VSARPSASFADVDYDEAMRRARAIVPLLRERAAAAEVGREMPRETIADLHRTGLLRFHRPRRWGSRAGPSHCRELLQVAVGAPKKLTVQLKRRP
jgi:3-hydroxy-9,10-secoandrosta-1,3,5(10)-triene-9,17-dione monooxygenase